MEHVKKIIVSIQFNEEEIEVGELISEGKKIYYKYYSRFIESGLEISPFKLKLSNQLFAVDEIPFDGLPGVFADSLPDGWGRMLLDRNLLSKGILIEEISPLDRLAYVGTRGMGALNYKPEMEIKHVEKFNLELDGIANEMNRVLQGTSSEVLEELNNLAGSSGGARPKILVGYNSKTNDFIFGSTDLPKNYFHWIIKFPSSTDRKDIANIEFAYYKMAIAAGIEMSECKLFNGKSGKVYFGTKRFDRIGNQRLHLHSAAGLMHDNFRLSNLDYGHLMDCAFKLENHVGAYEKILRLAAFNVFANNRDDHSKNFSFLMDENGKWKFAPAYDLTFSSSAHGMQNTMVMGESKNPDMKKLMELANYFKIKRGKAIIEEVQDAVSNWNTFAKQGGVEAATRNFIGKRLLTK